jgi:hypothetical protein
MPNHIALLHADGGYDRGAIMSEAHARHRVMRAHG